MYTSARYIILNKIWSNRKSCINFAERSYCFALIQKGGGTEPCETLATLEYGLSSNRVQKVPIPVR